MYNRRRRRIRVWRYNRRRNALWILSDHSWRRNALWILSSHNRRRNALRILNSHNRGRACAQVRHLIMSGLFIIPSMLQIIMVSIIIVSIISIAPWHRRTWSSVVVACCCTVFRRGRLGWWHIPVLLFRSRGLRIPVMRYWSNRGCTIRRSIGTDRSARPSWSRWRRILQSSRGLRIASHRI